MVEERKTDADSKGSCESLSGGLKLKINLRDRQTVRKRHRSSSSASTDSSISANQEKQPKRSLDRAAIKRSRKERPAAVTTDDSGFHDNDSASTKPDDDSSDSLSKKTVSAEPTVTSKGSSKSEVAKKSMRSSMTRSEILLVDMNGSSPERNGLSDAAAAPAAVTETAAPSPSAALTNGQSRPQTPAAELTTPSFVKRLSRDELERLVLEQMCLAIRERGVTGALERKCESSDQQLERYKRRTETLHKQVTDLETVVRRFVQQSKGRNQSLVPPVKTTRSVGLQINNPGAPPLASTTQISASPKKTTPITLVSTATATKATTATSVGGHVKILTSTTTATSTTNSPSASASMPSHMVPARVPIPPCVTMQVSNLASYVPPQALPRSRSAPRRSDDSLGASKIATYVNRSDVRSDVPIRSTTAVVRTVTTMPTSRVVTVVPPPPAAGPAVALRPFKAADAAIVNNAVARSRAIVNNNNSSSYSSSSSSSSGLTVVSSASSTVTTVNKVTLPAIAIPKVIDLTDDEQDKSNKRAAAAAAAAAATTTTTASSSSDYVVRLSGAQQMVPKPLGSMMPNGVSPGARLVALKSTTLNGRSSINNSLNGSTTGKGGSQHSSAVVKASHPAALPATPLGPVNPNWKSIAPRPTLKISRVANGIVLSWTMQSSVPHADIASYQLFAYQEGSAFPASSLWKRVGDVKALPLPMACTLTQFLEGHRYHFAVRAMDVHQRLGPYSEPASIVLS